jgi:uncharacterized protein
VKNSSLHVVSFVTGLVFALGLGLSGMTHPAKVVGFLDVTGAWDPSLAFVMGGAVVVNYLFFRLVLRRPHPLYDSRFRLPDASRVDAPLVVGAALFGAGWGLAGLCPGPALVSVATLRSDALVFVAAMTAGAFAFRLYKRLQAARAVA